jgi:hypothetical protein
MSGAKSMRDFIFMEFNFVCEKTKQISANSYTVREKISRMQSHSPKGLLATARVCTYCRQGCDDILPGPRRGFRSYSTEQRV